MPTDRERDRAFKAARKQALAQGLNIRRDTYAEIRRLLDLAQERITRVLEQAPTDYQRWSLPQLQQAIQAATGELAAKAGQAVASGMGASWEAGIALVDAPLRAGGVRIDAILPRVDLAQLEGMRAFSVDKIKGIASSIAERVASNIGLTIIGAQPVSETVDAVQGVVAGGRRRALTIVRTELGRAYATATQARMEQAAPILPELRKQWRRSGKVHSRLNHDAIDGQIREVDQPFVLPGGVSLLYPRAPAGPLREVINCGCESLPFMEGWPMSTPGARPYSAEEKLRKGAYSDARGLPAPGAFRPD